MEILLPKGILIAAMYLGCFNLIYAQDFPTGAVRGHYSDYFKYYERNRTNYRGTDDISDGTIALWDEGGKILFTGFLIYSDLDSGKTCLCSAGHVIKRSSIKKYTWNAGLKYWGEGMG